MLTKREVLRSGALTAITIAATRSAPVLAQTGTDSPGFFKAKDIAEAGFIYGLPIVMNYGVMYEYAIDRNSGQFKAPFNQIKNEAQRLHLQGHRHRHAEQRHAILVRMAGPARRADRAFASRRWIRSATTRYMLCDGNTYNYGYIGSRATGSEAGDYMVVGPGLEGRHSGGHQEGVSVKHAVFARRLSHPAFQSGRYGQRQEGSGRLQGAAAFGLSEPAAADARAAVDFPKIDKELVKTNFFDYLDFALQFAPAQDEREGDPRAACAHRHRAGQDLQLQGSLRSSRRPKSARA